MKFRFASAALFALALPLAAQAPAAAEAEGMFYKAFYLEKGTHDYIGAMALYQEFLDKAPESKMAGEAARQNFLLLGSTGKTKERDAFKAKYAKLLGDMANAPAAGERPARGGADAAGGERPARGQGGGQGGPGFGGRMDPAARMAELEKALATAKESGDADAVKKAEADIERAKQMAQRGGRGRGGLMGVMANNKKYSEMTDEEKTQLKDAVGQAGAQIDRMRENGMDDAADKLETGVAALKKALDGGKAEDVQAAIDTLRASMPQRGRRGGGGGGGGGGGAGGGGGGGQRPAGGGGGGGNNGGGGGR